MVGSNTYGVAKGVALHSAPVLLNEGHGDYSGVIAGIDYFKGLKLANPSRKLVINMSLGGGLFSPADDAVNSAVAAGVVVVVSAGNYADDACYYSPAAASGAITVGAVDSTDTQASFSNWGPCVNIYAPGVSILSLSNYPNVAYYADGTSMAAPHVTGAMALYLDAGKTAQDLLDDAAMGILNNVGPGSPNKMLYIPAVTYLTSSATTSRSPIMKSTKVPRGPTTSPTSSDNPTRNPTKAPTKHPTKMPTKIPTKMSTLSVPQNVRSDALQRGQPKLLLIRLACVVGWHVA
jgi:subtilisin family serine protease